MQSLIADRCDRMHSIIYESESGVPGRVENWKKGAVNADGHHVVLVESQHHAKEDQHDGR
jgi:hypothetical protein